VAFSDTTDPIVYIDYEGKYGLTQHGIGLKIQSVKEGERIKASMLTQLYRKLEKSLSFSNY